MNNESVSGFIDVLSIIFCCSAAQANEPVDFVGGNQAALLNSVSSQLESQLDINLAPDMEAMDVYQGRASNNDAVQIEEMDSLSTAQSQSQVARIER